MFGHALAETNGNRLLVCSFMPAEGDCRSATDDGVHGINERRGGNQFFAEVLPELQNETKLHALTVRWEVSLEPPQLQCGHSVCCCCPLHFGVGS